MSNKIERYHQIAQIVFDLKHGNTTIPWEEGKSTLDTFLDQLNAIIEPEPELNTIIEQIELGHQLTKTLEEIAVVMSLNDDAPPLDLASYIKNQWRRVIEDVSWAKAYVAHYWETRSMGLIMEGVWNILEDYLDDEQVKLAALQIADTAEQEIRGSVIPVVSEDDEEHEEFDDPELDTELSPQEQAFNRGELDPGADKTGKYFVDPTLLDTEDDI